MKTTQKRTRKTSSTAVHKHLKHALIPHKGNHFRPHLVRLHGITAVLVFAVALQLVYGAITEGRMAVLGRVSTIDTTQLLTSTNVERESEGLEPLSENASLSQAAGLKANDMITNNYWAHISPTGVEPWKWLSDVGYSYSVAGENLAKNYPNAQATVSAWMDSESHRKNILDERYTEVGFAVVDGVLEGRETTLVVALYGAPLTAVASIDNDRQPLIFVAPVGENPVNPLVYFGSALQSISPATLGALAMLTLVSAVAVAAHHYRKQLPKAWRTSSRRHHGMYTFIGAISVGVLMILATGGGQL